MNEYTRRCWSFRFIVFKSAHRLNWHCFVVFVFMRFSLSRSLLVIVIIFVGWPRCGFCHEIETDILSLVFVQAHTRCIAFHSLARTLCKMSSRIFENIWQKTSNKIHMQSHTLHRHRGEDGVRHMQKHTQHITLNYIKKMKRTDFDRCVCQRLHDHWSEFEMNVLGFCLFNATQWLSHTTLNEKTNSRALLLPRTIPLSHTISFCIHGLVRIYRESKKTV